MAYALDSLLCTNISEVIDAGVVSDILSAAPFVQIDGLFNFRDISDGSQPSLRSRYCLRCGSFELITAQGKSELVSAGVKKIFDLRSAREIAQSPHGDIPGVDIVAAHTDTGPIQSAQQATLSDMYLDMLESYRDTWKRILEHVLHHANQPFVLHCTAGKDRTGVAVALILGITGVPASYIAREYGLTRIGIEPARELLISKLPSGQPIDWNNDNVQTLFRADPGVMDEFLREVDDRYGGVVGYIIAKLGFTQSEIEGMRRNLCDQ